MKMETLSVDSGSPITQSLSAVVGLLNSLGRPTEPLPEVVDLGTVKFVRSNKGDVYYTVTATECSCPSFTYRGGPCKHQRRHFGEDKRRGQTLAETLEEHDRNIHRMPKSYQRMVRDAREDAEAEPLELINRSGFKPVLE
jgi:metal-sulfur cluster biosynthetic enzyme